MKTTTTAIVLLTLSLVPSGCISYTCTPSPRPVPAADVSTLRGVHPIAVVNATPDAGRTLVIRYISHRWYMNLHDLAECAVSTVGQALASQNINVDGHAAKSLQLSVAEANATIGFSMGVANLHALVILRVKTGAGREKEYTGRQNYISLYTTTVAIEQAMAHCIVQMLNDKDIIAYLEQ